VDKTVVVTRNEDGEALRVLGTQVRFLCEAEQTGQAWSLMEVRVPKDAGPPPHDHDWDEAYYIVRGELEFTLGSERMHVRAGDFLYAPGGTLHGFRGLSDEDACVLIFDAPAHAGSFFREVDREVRAPHDRAKVPAIGQRHGIRFAARAEPA